MWTVAKIKITNLNTFKKELAEKVGNDIKFYYPKIEYFKYDYKRSIYPKSLLDTDYYDYLGKNYKNFDSNTTIFGQVPPILKLLNSSLIFLN